MIKLIPCIVLTVVSFRLINSLMEAKRRKAQLKGRKGQGEEGGGGDRTTRMLLAVLLLFLMTEFPQGILGLLSLLLGDSFFKSCYIPLGDLMDIVSKFKLFNLLLLSWLALGHLFQVALANSAINFVLYTSMSLKFRQVFIQTFGSKLCCPRRLAPAEPIVTSRVGPSHSIAITPSTNGVHHSEEH